MQKWHLSLYMKIEASAQPWDSLCNVLLSSRQIYILYLYLFYYILNFTLYTLHYFGYILHLTSFFYISDQDVSSSTSATSSPRSEATPAAGKKEPRLPFRLPSGGRPPAAGGDEKTSRADVGGEPKPGPSGLALMPPPLMVPKHADHVGRISTFKK